MTESIRIMQTLGFSRKVKKLNKAQKKDLDDAVRKILKDPLLGERKKGDLSYLRVFKFKMSKQLTLLGYSYEDGEVTLQLIALGPHENFYRDLKRA